MTENLMARMPVISNIYGAIKQIMETVLSQNLILSVMLSYLSIPEKEFGQWGSLRGPQKEKFKT